jgi:hypothetical protein
VERIRQLGDFSTDCRTLEPEAFVQRHGEAFFLHHGPIGKLFKPQDLGKTMELEIPSGIHRRSFNPQADYLVFPVRTTATGDSDEGLFSIGRDEDNEIAVPDASISSVHALLRRSESGDFYIRDMDSLNGSFVNNNPVPTQEQGEAVKLESGDRVRLGGVRLTFLKEQEFRSLITSLLL